MAKALGIVALLLGLAGAIANGYAATRQLRSDELILGKETADSARRWSIVGWVLVGLGAVAGIFATVLG